MIIILSPACFFFRQPTCKKKQCFPFIIESKLTMHGNSNNNNIVFAVTVLSEFDKNKYFKCTWFVLGYILLLSFAHLVVVVVVVVDIVVCNGCFADDARKYL
jgi:hypothetical protein